MSKAEFSALETLEDMIYDAKIEDGCPDPERDNGDLILAEMLKSNEEFPANKEQI